MMTDKSCTLLSATRELLEKFEPLHNPRMEQRLNKLVEDWLDYPVTRRETREAIVKLMKENDDTLPGSYYAMRVDDTLLGFQLRQRRADLASATLDVMDAGGIVKNDAEKDVPAFLRVRAAVTAYFNEKSQPVRDIMEQSVFAAVNLERTSQEGRMSGPQQKRVATVLHTRKPME